MLSRLFGFGLALAMATAAGAQTLSDHVMVKKHQLMTGLSYSHDSWDEYYEGTLERDNGNIGELTTETAAFFADYGITDRLNVLALVPYVWTEASQGTLHPQDGVGTFAPSGHWNQIASDFIRGASFSEVRIARTFAFLNTAEFDAIVGCWDAKYAFLNPRPTQVDPSIKTHVGLPNFPAYTSGHSSFSAAAAAVLTEIFPAGVAYFNQERDEAAQSRLFGGIHYRSDIEQGKAHGARIAQFTIDFLRTDGAGQ